MTGEGKQGREEQKFFPIITRQNKFDELLGRALRSQINLNQNHIQQWLWIPNQDV
ncbi:MULTISPECIES: hypothetical protein [Nostocales]|uniref:hypothetical protein n=1 Tax=Nostocales TaxID=1161 RepID=UPI000A3F3ECA|nr:MULTISPECIES: hypothetical protein [Nostocales]QSV69369.1 MAG: hypothetical protein HEQ20_11095 [Aphanizomenon flos-aquae KM1D3_PB]